MSFKGYEGGSEYKSELNKTSVDYLLQIRVVVFKGVSWDQFTKTWAYVYNIIVADLLKLVDLNAAQELKDSSNDDQYIFLDSQTMIWS